ncbi:epidermal growth factor-like protein 7 isoform X4 [Tupaia chinensis]|nr:epidermal growth factor-like protein 7 isoform X4 [Tupaia chinensis]XP_027622073.1 epidermal growth factor-like protein 7 isoform X4 [Tupaia chinensis]
MQRVYQPFLTTCDGHRACSTYRTIYKTAYRRSPGLAPTRPRYACCPGWKRTERPPGTCRAAPCQPPCQNGGSCVHPGHCRCPAGWQGDACQEDVDECHTWGGGCPQRCINTAGSFWCQCWEGHSPSADGTFCLPTGGPHRVAPSPTAGMDSAVKEEVERLRSRVDVLEQAHARSGDWPGPGPISGHGEPKDPSDRPAQAGQSQPLCPDPSQRPQPACLSGRSGRASPSLFELKRFLGLKHGVGTGSCVTGLAGGSPGHGVRLEDNMGCPPSLLE